MVGGRRSEEDQVEFRVVAAGNPDRTALALRTGDIVPGVSAGIVRPGYRLKTPQFLAAAGVYADYESAFGHHRRGDSLDDHAIGEQWRGPQRIAVGAVRANRDGVLPDWFAGAEVQREQSQIKRGHNDGFPINRYAELPVQSGGRVGSGCVLISPKFLAAARVERQHRIVGVGQKHHAVMHKRSRHAGALP